MPNRRWNGKPFWRISGSENIHLNPGSPRPRRRTRKSSRRITRIFFNLFIHRYHVEPRVELYVPTEESFPIPLKYIDVTRTTDTTLNVMLEKISTIIGTLMEIENCQIRGQVSRFTVLDENHRMDFHGPGGD